MAATFLAALVLAAAALGGCASAPHGSSDAADDCLARMALEVRAAAPRETIQTLDGQQVPLAEFFDKCLDAWPGCVLFEKFYHWPGSVKTVEGAGPNGRGGYRVRAYFNPLSTCLPERASAAGTVHGDVAEIYDLRGEFMGLAVHMGQGHYFTIPYSGYGKQ